MNKSINTVLEGIRERLDAPKTEQTTPLPVAEGKFSQLVTKLKKKKGVKDPVALAAWIGRKKYGKERFAKMSQKESVDVTEMLVFEDVEDVLAFVEGLESLLEDPVDEAKKKKPCMASGPGDRRCQLDYGHKGPHKMHKDTWESVEKPVVETKTDSVGALLILLRTVSKDLENTLARAGHVMRKNRQGSALIGRGLDIIGDIDKLRKDINSTTFAEGIEPDSEEPVVEALDHAAMGAYRRANPKDGPAAYLRVRKVADEYNEFLRLQVVKERDLKQRFIFAANSLKKSIEDSYGDAGKAMPGTLEVWQLIRSDAASGTLLQKLHSLILGDEMKIGSSKVRG